MGLAKYCFNFMDFVYVKKVKNITARCTLLIIHIQEYVCNLKKYYSTLHSLDYTHSGICVCNLKKYYSTLHSLDYTHSGICV